MGNLISFNSPSAANINSLKVHFKPKQNLNGQTKPWPAGGGKNILNMDWFTATNSYIGSTGSTGNMSYYSYTDYLELAPNTYTISGVNNTVNSNLRIHSYDENKEWVKQLASKYMAEGAPFSLTFTVTSDDKYIRISAPAKTPENPYLQLEVGSSATAYVPYENICPIEGWESVEAYMAKENLTPSAVMTYPITFPVLGKNKLNPVWESGGINTSTGNAQTGSGSIRLKNKIDVIPNKIYALSWSSTNRNIYRFAYKKDGSFSRYLGLQSVSGQTITLNNDEYYIWIYQYNNTDEPENIQLELGSTATTYTPYSSNNTIYGGYVDFAAGKVVQTMCMFEIDKDTTVTVFEKPNSGTPYYKVEYNVPLTGANKNVLYCNKMEIRARNSAANYWPTPSALCALPYDSNVTKISIGIPEEMTTQQEWLDWLENNGPIQVVYELATPIEYPITPQTLTTFHGPNNIWSNTNSDTEISYDLYETSRLTTIKKRIIAAAPHVNTTSTANTVSFTTDMRAPLPQCKVSFVPRQGGSGTASPTNVRPIYGLKYLSVMNSGKNLVDVSTFTTGKGLNSSGQLQSWDTTMLSPYIPLPGGNYYVSGISRASGTNNLRIHGFDENKQWVKQIIAVSAAQNAEYAGTFDFGSSNVKYIRVSVNINTENLQIEQGTTKSQYEPYSGGLWTADWETAAGEVYGGYVDLVKGELVVEWVGVTATYADGEGTFVNNRRILYKNTYSGYVDESKRSNLISNIGKYGTGGAIPYCYVTNLSQSNEIQVQWGCDDSYTGAITAQVAYPLATPITYSLTPTQLLTFKGTNNLYASHNTITAKYWTH